MSKEEIQTLLSDFGFEETLSKTLEGINLTHMIHCCSKLRKLVVQHINRVLNILSLVKSLLSY